MGLFGGGGNRYIGPHRLRGACPHRPVRPARRPRTKAARRNRIGIAAVRTANARFFAQKPDHARNA
ncbi:hypothetical protein EZV77_14665 [Burkholderia thailandensis]|nr:hypothetical protein A8H32_09550 [Burkholderia thailandensis]MDD1478916.1 hypothetical protein [Burkholderia thailandensis]MDD1486047.1 hypothetical protein [Burkholderia thailandensis]MDD1490787.1 hypothetical protein [Burkholderia thailandensis]PJO73154.1 hypothetical protein CWD92_05815 [Burkholderia thailandensis]